MVRLSGAYIELYDVADPGGVETETKVAETRDDIELAMDITEASGRAHGEAIVQRQPLAYQQSFTFSGFVADDLAALTTLGILDATKIRGFAKAKLEALRLKVFARDGDATESQRILLEDIELVLGNISWEQDDYATFEAEAYVNGEATNEAIA